ncbi:MAG: hypothetical protein IKL68_05700 [Clostridia bacterium]|nr:hypothetical protein [Clostridia bacterium]
MRKGISLIVLVITIIVMIVLAAAVVITLNNAGIINKADDATFITNIKLIIEEYGVFQGFYILEGNDIKTLNVGSDDLSTIIKSIPEDWAYKDKLEIIKGELTYMVDPDDVNDVERAKKVCLLGMKVDGADSCNDVGHIEPHKTSYAKVGNIYYNTPDISNFNATKTYFVTYDSNGNEKLGKNITRKAPEDWFDYENKEWANIVVINGNLKTYLVWIPRYAYKVDSTNKVVDVRFVDNNNTYIAPDGTQITYNDTVPTFDANGNQTNYVVNSAFNINMGTDENPSMKALGGFWMSKYEAQNGLDLEPAIEVWDTSIEIFKCSSAIPSGYKYEYYLNGNLITTLTTGTYKFENLTPNTVYHLVISLKTGDLEVGRYEETIRTPATQTYNQANAPELGALSKAGTYYLTWDADGNEIRTEVVDESGNKVNAPADWYDYDNKEWANIVVVNETIGSETYLVWIPRYEYRVLDGNPTTTERKVDIAFISANQTEPTPGYIIQSAFILNMGTDDNPSMKHIPGFWMSKYEAQNVTTN